MDAKIQKLRMNSDCAASEKNGMCFPITVRKNPAVRKLEVDMLGT